MSEERKTLGVAFWGTVAVVVVLAGYPLSWGPACWLDHHGWLTGSANDLALWFYSPINWIYHYGPKPLADAVKWYGDLWA
jgi:hypothetical protein